MMLIAAGPTSTTKMPGKMNRINGNNNCTAVLAAFSSASCLRRVQSDSMRTRRKQLAEEKAAKTAVQLLFPLILFIFPGIFVVLVGPAAIKMMAAGVAG